MSPASILRRLRSISDEGGFALVIALGTLIVLSAVIVSAIDYTSANSRSSSLSKSSGTAFNLAEAALNDAESVLSAPSNNAFTGSLLDSTPTATDCDVVGTTCQSKTYTEGTAKWRGVLNATATPAYWTIYAYGYVTNPTGFAAKNVERKLTARVNVIPDPTQPRNVTAWNYVISSATSNATTCDMSVPNSVTLTSSLYVAGNLCLSQSASVQEPNSSDPVTMTVMGKLAFGNSSNVGLSANSSVRPTQAGVGGGCTSSIASAGHTCNPNSPVNDPFYVRSFTSSPSTIAIPTLTTTDYQNAYNSSNPGPTHACTTVSGTTGPTWDNGTPPTLDFTAYPNGSAYTTGAPFNLTPASDYICESKDASGKMIGQLDWNHTTNSLTILGEMYIDGSASVTNNATNVYSGSGTLYLSGVFTMSGGQTRLCAANTGTVCDFSTWDPNSHMLIIVAHGNDGSGNSVTFRNAVEFQGGLFAQNACDLGQASISEGPMICSTVKVGQSVTLKPLPYINTLPLGAPGNPNTHATPSSPSFTSG